MSHLRVAVFQICLMAASTALFAQTAKPSKAKAIDVGHSTMTVHVFRSGVFAFAGDNHDVRAPITAGTVNETLKTVEFTVDARKLQVLDPKLSAEKRGQVQQKMLSPDVLDAQKFHEIKFRSTKVEAEKDGLRVSGNLTLHGQTHPVVAAVSAAKGSYRGSATVKQTDFGIKPVSIGGGTVKVKDEVKIDFEIVTR